MSQAKNTIAYFSMEFALDDRIPNYAGGLGVLAADLMMSAADLEMPLVGVTLLYHQDDDPDKAFPAAKFLKPCKPQIEAQIEDRQVKVLAWKKEVKGRTGHTVPIYFLSCHTSDNPQWDRDLTKHLYAAHAYTRLGQETVLGVGGVKMLEALGYEVRHYHLNEGHSAPAGLAYLQKPNNNQAETKKHFSFTTHTPVSSGHDYFEYELTRRMIGHYLPDNIRELAGADSLGMTELALNLSRNYNSVSLKHKEICEQMFPNYTFENITNGVYHPRWTGRHWQKLLDKHLKNWSKNPEKLAEAIHCISSQDLSSAKQSEKEELVDWINSHPEFLPLPDLTEEDYLDKQTLTIGFARRMVPYKRTSLIFHDLDRLRRIGYKKLQLVFAGNIHEDDGFSREMADLIDRTADQLRGQVKIVLIPYYNLAVSQRLVAGCDVWLNNPIPEREASGTSGMKAALNGGLNLSIMDGWWIEAFKSDIKSGWGFGEFLDDPDRDVSDFDQLMTNLSDVIDCYYNRPEEWGERMKHSVALISFFNTHRAIKEYASKMWSSHA